MAMPIMANVHLLSDSVGTPMLSLATMYIFRGCLPSFISYLFFIPYFCIAMFGVAGLPCGGIIVMMPLLTSQFGFTEEMIAVVMSLYVLLDPFGTAANVMGDGALVIIVNKVLKKIETCLKKRESTKLSLLNFYNMLMVSILLSNSICLL